MTDQTSKPATKRPRRMAREPQQQDASVATANASAPSETAPTKTAQVINLLTRPEGATLNQMVEATGWLPHTTRAALTGLKKKGHEVISAKVDGVRTYRLIATRQPNATLATHSPVGA